MKYLRTRRPGRVFVYGDVRIGHELWEEVEVTDADADLLTTQASLVGISLIVSDSPTGDTPTPVDPATLLATRGDITTALAGYALADPVTAITYNLDGTVASVTEGGVTTTYTYNGDGTVATQTRLGVTRTFTYSGGNLTGVA